MSTRGEHLVRADRRFATGGGLVARLSAPAIARVLDEIDKRLSTGGIEATLPDGSSRRLGFRGDGPRADRPSVELDGAGAARDLRFGRLVQGLDPG